jgi:hypothetical protein
MHKENMVDYWRNIIAISDGPRSNLSKGFNYFGGFKKKHFKAHVEALRQGIKYRWLIYGTKDEVEELWKDYRDHLHKNNVNDKVIDDQIQCRFFPTSSTMIPMRVTIFGNKIALSSPEEKKAHKCGKNKTTYGKDQTTVTFSKNVAGLLDVFNELWDLCPDINSGQPHPYETHLETVHKKFKDVYLEYYSESYYKDVPIYRLEMSLNETAYSFYILAGSLIVAIILLLFEVIHIIPIH